ncbi:MAG TPA: DUF1801 domain-containing protein [Ktedonobacterales bacterium]|nr:DUF1801 domain-containing protein [Ktedonobacterales bacterium]
MQDQIDSSLASYPPEVATICRLLRATAQQSMPAAQELWYHSSIGYAVSTSPFDRICYIAPQNGYVNLGFFFGTHLEDPQHLLEGTGARMRHVKVRTLAQAGDPALAALLKAAWLDGAVSVAEVKAKRARNSAEKRSASAGGAR